MSVPLEREKIIVLTLLVGATIALIGPWHDGGSRIATELAAWAVLVALIVTCWSAGRAWPARLADPTHPDWQPLIDRLDRIAEALELRPIAAPVAAEGLATITRAIAEGRWDDAEAILAGHPDHPEVARYSGQLASAKQTAGESMREELTAAQGVNDPERVLEIHARLAPVLEAEARAEVEVQVVKWFLALIMRRLRGGSVRPDVAELAAKVAERFPRSVEGASLRASLATLRRSAGLCPRCARPYRGIADACPLCLAATEDSVSGPATDGAAKSEWAVEPPAEEDLPVESSPDGSSYPEFLDNPT